MANGKVAAIGIDEIRDKTLKDISAADFLAALASGGREGAMFFRAWPEKKKVELFMEAESSPVGKIGVLFDRMKEKKKYELEKPPLTEHIHKPPGPEFEFDPTRGLIDPVDIAREVVLQLRAAGLGR